MSKMNAKSLSGLRQKVRKYNKEVMEADITAYKANPDPAGYESPEDEVKVRDREGKEWERSDCSKDQTMRRLLLLPSKRRKRRN